MSNSIFYQIPRGWVQLGCLITRVSPAPQYPLPLPLPLPLPPSPLTPTVSGGKQCINNEWHFCLYLTKIEFKFNVKVDAALPVLALGGTDTLYKMGTLSKLFRLPSGNEFSLKGNNLLPRNSILLEQTNVQKGFNMQESEARCISFLWNFVSHREFRGKWPTWYFKQIHLCFSTIEKLQNAIRTMDKDFTRSYLKMILFCNKFQM